MGQACDAASPAGPRALQVASLKALGLNIRRAKLKSGKEQKFYVTDSRTSEKVGAGRASKAGP